MTNTPVQWMMRKLARSPERGQTASFHTPIKLQCTQVSAEVADSNSTPARVEESPATDYAVRKAGLGPVAQPLGGRVECSRGE